MAGGDVHSAFELVMDDGMGQDGRRRGIRAKNNAAAVIAHYTGGRLGKFRREKSCIVPNDDRGILFLGGNVTGDCGGGSAHAGKSEIIGDNTAPARSSEMDRLLGHGQTLYRGRWVEITQERNESQE